MTVGELRAALARYAYHTEVYAYDMRRDVEREIFRVGPSNELMSPGVVLEIGRALKPTGETDEN